MKKMFLVAALIMVLFPNPVKAIEFDASRLNVNLGFGIAVPVRSVEFVNEAEGSAWHRFASVEYPVASRGETEIRNAEGLVVRTIPKPRFSLGIHYSGQTFDLRNPEYFQTMKGGGEVTSNEISSTAWGPYLITHFDLIPENNWELYVKIAGTKNEVTGLVEQQGWKPAAAFGTEFDAHGSVRARGEIAFWDVAEAVDGEIGAMFFSLQLNFHPFDTK